MKKKCSIVFYEGWLNSAPTILNIAKALFEKDFAVTVFCRKKPANVIFDSEVLDGLDKFMSVVYFPHPSDIFLLGLTFKLLRQFKLGTLIPLIDTLIFFIEVRIYKFKNKLSVKYEEIIIGVDTNGSIVAFLESVLLRNKNIYLSLELTRETSFRYFDKLRYFLDKAAYQKSRCLIIQDEDRFEHMTTYSKHKQDKVFYIPNSSGADSSLSFGDEHEFRYFRQMFDLDNNKYPCIVLHAGMICDAVLSKELVRSFNSINIDCALVLHEGQKKRLEEQPYLQALTEINSKNLFLSLNPVPYEDIYKVFKSADIGVAFYRAIDENFSKIAKASGKLSFYLKYGKPVLMNNLQSLVDLNDRYKVGIIIKDPTDHLEIELAIKEINSKYDYFSNNALICFKEEFDFNLKINSFLSFIAA